MRRAEALRWAGRSLVRELWRFRIDYPIEVIPAAAGQHSLRYHLFSPRLFLEDQELDPLGVPRKRYRLLGPQYNPLFVAWWGLHHLERYARSGEDRSLQAFRTQLNWLVANALAQEDGGAVVWPCAFDWQEGRARLRGPWISAMYQAVVMSALVRGFRLTQEEKLLDLALRASRVFWRDVGQGGVRTSEEGEILYEEYPAYPLPRVLDGFLFSLLGLYDLAVETGDAGVQRLFMDGLRGLIRRLPWWSYRGKWSWYGSHGYLCPPHYHALNRALLTVLHQLTGEAALQDMAAAWAPSRLSRQDRVEIFLAFALTKNWARLRLPNQRKA